MSLATRPDAELIERMARPGIGPQYVPPSHAFVILRRHKLLLALLALGLGGPAIAVIAMLAPYYEAEALIMVATGKTEFSDLQVRDAAGAGPDATTLRTQSDIIHAPMMARRVVDRLDLIEVPEFGAGADRWPPLVKDGWRWLQARLGAVPAAEAAASEPDLRQAAAARLVGKLTVGNDGRSYIISVRVRTAERALAARIANTYAELYLDFARQLKLAAIARGNSLLDAQLAPLRERVRLAEDAVERYREQNGLVLNRAGDAPSGQGVTVAEQQLNQIVSQLMIARGDLAQKEANLHGARAGGRLDAVPEVVASPLVQRLREQEATLTEHEASLNRTLLGDNPVMQSAHAARADVRQRIDAEVGKIVASLGGEVVAARARRDSLEAALARVQTQVTGQSQANVSLRQLQSEADAAKAVYKDYLWRYEQTSNQAALQQPEADLVSPAETPLEPAGPPRKVLAAIAALAALLLAALAALGVERRRGGVRTAEQLEVDTGLFPLGFIPVAARGRRAWLSGNPSTYTAAVDLVGSLLRHGDAAMRARVVLVTSAAAREGKTFFAISLAAGVGRGGGRALLVDCDVWRPRVAAMLGLTDQAATDAPASGNAAPAATLRHAVLPGLDVVTFAAPEGRPRRPLAAEQIGIFVGEARARYDLVVLDTPPVLAFADAPLLGPLADGAILVVRWRHTPSVAVLGALRTLRAYGVRVLGGVVTQVKLQDLARSEGAHARLRHARSLG